MASSSMRRRLVEARLKVREVIQELEGKVLSLPDNPSIKRISSRPSCFTISSRSLTSDNWSVAHYDFKEQYRLIVKQLEKGDPRHVLRRLKTIIRNGWICISRHQSMKLHKDVVLFLKKIMEEDRKENQ